MVRANKRVDYTYRGLSPSEDAEQEALFEWAELMKGRYPELCMMAHVANEGKRSQSYGAKLKRMGMKRGFPDITLPAPRGNYHGLYIELKALDGTPSDDQLWWLDKLTEQGYKAVLAYGAGEAIEIITRYMEGKK